MKKPSKLPKPNRPKAGKGSKGGEGSQAAKVAAFKKTPQPHGRPALWSQELADEFCYRVASGRAISNVCEDEDMPSERTTLNWRRDHPGFVRDLARAREARHEKLGEQMTGLALGIVGSAQGPRADPAKVRVAIDGLDKSIRVMKDHVVVKHVGPSGGPVEYADVTESELERRLEEMSDEEFEAIERARRVLDGRSSGDTAGGIAGKGKSKARRT